MMNINKIYTKEEFIELKNKNEFSIGVCDLKNNHTEYFDSYISSKIKNITPEIKKLYKEGKLGVFTSINDYNNIIKLGLEAVERVKAQSSKSVYAKKIRKQYSTKLNHNLYYKGYWTGIIAAIRFITDYNFDIADLRKTKNINYVLKHKNNNLIRKLESEKDSLKKD